VEPVKDMDVGEDVDGCIIDKAVDKGAAVVFWSRLFHDEINNADVVAFLNLCSLLLAS